MEKNKNKKGEKKMKTYTIEIEAVRTIDVVASSKEEAFKKIIEYKMDYHCGNTIGAIGEVESQWHYDRLKFEDAQFIYEEDYQ